MRSSLVTSFLIVFFLAYCDAKMKSKCPPQRTTDADECAKKAFFLLNPDYEGHGGLSVDGYCSQVSESLTCIEKFNKDCLKDFTKQSANMGLGGMKKHYRSICVGKAPKRAEFLQKTKWVKKEHINKLSPCVQASVSNMNFISETKNVPSDKQIPQTCCNYHLTRKCLSDKMKPMTTEENKKFLEEMADDTLKSLVDFLCSKQTSIEACQHEIGVPTMKSLKAKFKNPGPKENFQSILIPFLNVLSD